jgi:5-methylcytosine-specific restriction endonuclease McrA
VALPKPDSRALASLVRNEVARRVYRVLYESRGNPLDIHEIRDRLGLKGGVHQHLDRRLRQLDPYFVIERERRGRDTTYRLVSQRAKPLVASGRISKKLRAWVLRDQRCAQCGRTPTDDGVRLHVDHKIPQEWGGSNEPENLQALCSECNEGKKNYYASLGNRSTRKILAAANHDEPHRRIGEALKAAHPKRLRGDLLERIASARQYQEDWQKRLRELRVLGWRIDWEQKQEQGRRVTYYFLAEPPPPWPEGPILPEIRRRERAPKQKRRPRGR